MVLFARSLVLPRQLVKWSSTGVVKCGRGLATAPHAQQSEAPVHVFSNKNASPFEPEYEDYTSTSHKYDELRKPIGLDSLDNALTVAAQAAGCTVSELNLLDVGCGTGNYINVLKHKVGSCNGLEFNDGMFAQSQAKHLGDERVTLQQGSVLNMDCFQDESFDTVIMTQVLHHLTPDTHSVALSEIARVLKPGGVFWISTQTPQQHVDGFWWSPIIPKAVAMVAARFASSALFESQLTQAGLQLKSTDVPAEPLIPLEWYADTNGPLNEVYRNCDSTWALATAEELAAGLDWWQSILNSGEADTYLKDREAVRAVVGQTTAVTAVKQ